MPLGISHHLQLHFINYSLAQRINSDNIATAILVNKRLRAGMKFNVFFILFEPVKHYKYQSGFCLPTEEFKSTIMRKTLKKPKSNMYMSNLAQYVSNNSLQDAFFFTCGQTTF